MTEVREETDETEVQQKAEVAAEAALPPEVEEQAPPLAVAVGPLTVVDTGEAYEEAVQRLAQGHGPIAVDAERASGFRYSQRAYLIQLFRRGSGTVLLDPTAFDDLTALAEVLREPEWILHAASQDLPCLREVGLEPTRLFDTELCARLLGMARVGLGAVIDELLQLHLKKEHSAADWSTRPLPVAWLEYAALDVELLIDVRDRMVQLLAESGKTAIAAEEFDAELRAAPRPPRSEPWRRLSGVHAVHGQRNLAVARELWRARDAYAQAIDSAPGRLVPDSSLVAVARTPPASKRELVAMRTFSGRASRSEIDRWWAAVETALATEDLPLTRVPADGPPPPRAWADRNPTADRRLKAARAALLAVAERMSIPAENLLTPDVLRRVAWEPPEPVQAQTIGAAFRGLGAREWQITALAHVVADAFVQADQSVEGDAAGAS